MRRPPEQAGQRGLARLGPGDLLAALGDLPCGRAGEAYAALGYRVVPMHASRPDGGCTCQQGTRCPDPGKHPCLAGWPSAASTTPAEVRRWWWRWPQANVGLLCGARFDVCDLDGPAGVEALRAVLGQRHPAEHPGPVTRSGGGGWHLLFAPTGLGNRVGVLPGVDWRGRGGLMVAPPSRHASGRRYAWVRPLAAELPAVPAGLQALLAPPRGERTTLPPPQPAAGQDGRRGARYARAALEHEAASVRAAPAGTCNHALNRAAFNLGQLAAAGLLDAEQVRAVLLQAAMAAPATGHGDRERRARATINSGLAGGARKPRRRGRGVA
jgi:Bifunctional DNA primase/polymerase, N-terminal